MTTLALATGLANAQFKTPKQPQPAPAPSPVVGTLTSPQAAPQKGIESVRRIGRTEVLKLAKADKVVYVDVRSKEQFDLGHIKGALSIPGSQLLSRLRELPPGKMIITYCA